MANEIRAQGSLQIVSSGFTISGNNTSTISISGSQYGGSVVSVGTAFEALPLGDMGDFRYIYLENQSTASILVALGDGSQSLATLRPGDVMILPPSASWTNYFVKATQAAADIQFIATES